MLITDFRRLPSHLLPLTSNPPTPNPQSLISNSLTPQLFLTTFIAKIYLTIKLHNFFIKSTTYYIFYLKLQQIVGIALARSS
jgi:hypothetical protein